MEISKRRQIPTRSQISASERKISRFVVVFVTTSVTPINYTLVSSGNEQPSTRTHVRFYYDAAGRASVPTRAAPGIIDSRYSQLFGQCLLPDDRLLMILMLRDGEKW